MDSIMAILSLPAIPHAPKFAIDDHAWGINIAVAVRSKFGGGFATEEGVKGARALHRRFA